METRQPLNMVSVIEYISISSAVPNLGYNLDSQIDKLTMRKTESSVKTSPGLVVEIGSTTVQPRLQIEDQAFRDLQPSLEEPLTRKEIISDLLIDAVEARHDLVSRNVRLILEAFLSIDGYKGPEYTSNVAVRGSIQKLKGHLNNKDEAWVDIRISDLIWLLKQMLISSCVEDFLHDWASKTELMGRGYRQLNNVTAHVLEVIGTDEAFGRGGKVTDEELGASVMRRSGEDEGLRVGSELEYNERGYQYHISQSPCSISTGGFACVDGVLCELRHT